MATVVFMGTPDFAVPTLKALIQHDQVIGVVTQPDRPAGRGGHIHESPVKQLALGFHPVPDESQCPPLVIQSYNAGGRTTEKTL